MHTNNTLDLERSMLRMGSVAFIAGIVMAAVSTFVFHPTTENLMDNPVVFALYAQDNLWIGSHIGQFVGIMLVFAGGFVALHRLLVKSESGTASALSWLGLVTAIISASAFAILQAVDGIALKIAVNSWYGFAPHPANSEEEKAIAFQVAQGLRWTEWGVQAYYRMLQGAVALIFGVAIAKSAVLARWIGAVGIAAGVVTIAAGVVVAYVGFSSVRDPVTDLSTFILYPWIVILGIFMWRKTRAKKIISR
ncbi:MAG TPA: DUF4386 family protein [Nitrososphaeraceae archaeon]|nr:DUF4386 family protein [Nitrososphaeraceae archaeon]